VGPARVAVEAERGVSGRRVVRPVDPCGRVPTLVAKLVATASAQRRIRADVRGGQNPVTCGYALQRTARNGDLFPDTEEVTGSSPVSPTHESAGQRRPPRAAHPRRTASWLRCAAARAGASARGRPLRHVPERTTEVGRVEQRPESGREAQAVLLPVRARPPPTPGADLGRLVVVRALCGGDRRGAGSAAPRVAEQAAEDRLAVLAAQSADTFIRSVEALVGRMRASPRVQPAPAAERLAPHDLDGTRQRRPEPGDVAGACGAALTLVGAHSGGRPGAVVRASQPPKPAKPPPPLLPGPPG
jgi:hypothetical protein